MGQLVAIVKTSTLLLTGIGSLRTTIESVCARPAALAAWNFGERRARLVVGNVALSGVREEGQYGGDALSRSGMAGGDGDEKLHQVVVHLAAARLDDEDIFPTHTLSNLNAGLADGKLAEQNLGGGDTQVVADGLCELRMRAPTEDDDIADHDGRW